MQRASSCVCDQGVTMKGTIVAEADAKSKWFTKPAPRWKGRMHLATKKPLYAEVMNSSWCDFVWEYLSNNNYEEY